MGMSSEDWTACIKERLFANTLQAESLGMLDKREQEWHFRQDIANLLEEREVLREALEEAKQMIHEDRCGNDCDHHDVIDQALAWEPKK